ncbi:hypothetical protein CSOJ01_08170 [Colletotrichum sojae]|uniref:F-box domain-containing protein n=1 Tax=Colletotrichum sojae TaxID=2175907 RepID=A0A8H6J7I5_9PEZI|nr:hypothetical protein CSOJ01_08170 [Colletotrichum sojae]
MARLTDCPPEVLLEICKKLALSLQQDEDGYLPPSSCPETPDPLVCRAAIARLMRTCRKLHDVAGCLLYSGHYRVGHPSESFVFLRNFDDRAQPQESRAELVRHADLHTNLYRNSPAEIEWSSEQESLTDVAWISEMAAGLGICLPADWKNKRGETDDERWDRIVELANQLLVQRLATLTGLDLEFSRNWSFELLHEWAGQQRWGIADLLPNLRRLRIRLRSAEAAGFKCHKLILDSAPNLSTLEVHGTLSYTVPAGCRLASLRTLKFVDCSTDCDSMKDVVLAAPHVTHLEYRQVPSGDLTPKDPLLAPQMLCDLLRNDYARANPVPGDPKTKKLELPNLHRQLRILVLDFHSDDRLYEWDTREVVANLRDFPELKRLRIDTHSFTSRANGGNNLLINNLSTLIPEGLEALEITSVGRFCLEELTRTSLTAIGALHRKGRFPKLARIELADCELGGQYARQIFAINIKGVFERPGAPIIVVNGRIQRHEQSK